MNEQIDLSQLLDSIRAKRSWILITTGLAVLFGGLLFWMSPYRYVAEAVLVVTRPAAELQFDERFTAPQINPNFPYRVGSLRTYPELFQSDGMVHAVLQEIPEELRDELELNIDFLRDLTSIKSSAEGSLIRIEVRGRSPQEAVQLASIWADTAQAEAGQIFAQSAAKDAVESARDQAQSELDQRITDLSGFHESSALSALEVELESAQGEHKRLLATQARLTAAARDAAALAERISTGASSQSLAQLAALSLEFSALSSEQDDSEDRLQFEFTAGDLSGSVDAQQLLKFQDALVADADAMDQLIEAHSRDLGAIRAQLESEQQTLLGLERARNLSEERLITLSRKVNELEIDSQTNARELRLASPAVAIEGFPLGDFLKSLIMAGLLGLALSLGFLILRFISSAYTSSN